MMKRLSLFKEIFKLPKNSQFNFPQFLNFYSNVNSHFTTANSGIKTIDLIKILRAETSKL